MILRVLFFFFKAEDGIRDDLVTGVQTCALPILVLVTVRRISCQPTVPPVAPIVNFEMDCVPLLNVVVGKATGVMTGSEAYKYWLLPARTLLSVAIVPVEIGAFL